MGSMSRFIFDDLYQKIICKQIVKWYEYVFYFLSMTYATNQDQMCVILLAVYFVFTVYIFS